MREVRGSKPRYSILLFISWCCVGFGAISSRGVVVLGWILVLVWCFCGGFVVVGLGGVFVWGLVVVRGVFVWGLVVVVVVCVWGGLVFLWGIWW